MRRIVLAGLACMLLASLGAGGLVLWAARAVDRIRIEEETALVERRVERAKESMVEDVQSAAIWNDSVVALAARDLNWMQLNFGDYYADYMKHEITLVHDGHGRLLQASRASEVVAESEIDGFARATIGLRAAVAADARDPKRRRSTGFEAVAARTAVVMAEGAPWLVTVSTVVPEDDAVARPDVDGMVTSAMPLSVLVASLGADLGLSGARFAVDAGAGPSVAVTDEAGVQIGRLAWTPERPGTAVVKEAAPWLFLLVLLLGVAATRLTLWATRIGRRLSESEHALIAARDRAQAASEAKSRFLANMSHELRTPLNGVVAMGEILAQGELAPVQRERLDILRASSGDLTRMIEHLLHVTRLERGQLTVQTTPYDPAALARDVVAAHQERAKAKGLSLHVEAEELGDRLGDRAQVAKVLGYLLDNALTYTARGSVSLRLSQVDGRARFEVDDTGPGISDELMPQIFDVFTRGDDGLTSLHGGAGLGLSICRSTIAAMGGGIDLRSTPGEGTCVVVEIPAPVAAAQRLEVAA